VVRILVADDEQDLVWALRHSLADEGWEVICAHNGQEALDLAESERPDVILLDITMPVVDGLEVCRRLRRDPRLASTPVMFLTVSGATQDLVMGLDQGSDDYVVKPFALPELKARIRALLRRSTLPASAPAGEGGRSVLGVGALSLDLNRRIASLGDRAIELTPIEFALLRHLMLHPGQIYSSRDLLDEVWGYDATAAAPSLVRWHIHNLRRKIEPNADDPSYVRTASRHGYFLSSPS